MNIWFEITNSPHVNLFFHIIKDLEKNNNVIITCRSLANTIELLELHNFKYVIIGNHYGKRILNKLIGFPIRVIQLVKYFINDKPDVAIGQSSFQMPLASKILGVPCIYMNDNEYALGNIPSFLFADKIMIPEFLDKKKVNRQFGNNRKIIKYPGFKEGIYLWRILNDIKKDMNTDKKRIFFRPEPRTAQYYKETSNFVDRLLIELNDEYHVTIFPRDNEQKKHYYGNQFNGIEVLDIPLNLIEILEKCDLFIGAGGTMTREMAVAGIPTISVYQGKLLDVDNYLIKVGLLKYKKVIDKNFVDKYFYDTGSNNRKKNYLLQKGKEAERVIKNTIFKLGRKKCTKWE